MLCNTVAGFALLASTVASHAVNEPRAALAENPNLEISSLVVNGTSSGSTLLSFDVKNPEPLADRGMAECKGEWNTTAKDWPTSAQALRCDKSEGVTFFIDNWTSVRDFVIGIQDRFEDPSIGEKPYDRVVVFAKAVVNETTVRYDSTDEEADPISGQQKPNVTIYAPIYALSSK